MQASLKCGVWNPVFRGLIARAVVAIIGLPSTAEEVPYQGLAALCAITGTHYGTDGLSGVITKYELTPTELAQEEAICGKAAPLGGYRISCVLENYAVSQGE